MVASIAYIQHSVLRPWSFTGVVFIRLSMMNSMFGLLSWFLLSQADNMQTIRGSKMKNNFFMWQNYEKYG